MHVFSVKTSAHEELLDITSRVEAAVRESGIMDGICCVYTPHTTAAITINENADPDVRRDLLKGLRHLGLENVSFDHAEGNSPSHVKSSLVGCSETIIVNDGSLALGTWQGIYFCEFDGPRTRKVYVKII
ncbi:MAG TPA: secondary thiamine-phosphate synthase enzyme YjbQ [Spirochaetota bacterium]|nr:secondary thiamine-phosphate synthase enzyme YjbQ [Spirochaetota bacterium]HRZ26212.1 secondary thiamine-phosphate synthase enzyme YjbQ [Spirochaetota bacterium]HSA16184.1 secondary thiamine-phosphate synthase enzyme YjbQ [Spirochaetota bacterium]